MTRDAEPKMAVLYNAECPVCRFEINHYAEYSKSGSLPIRFDDLNIAETRARWDMDSDTAARRLHVVRKGELLSGIPAFIALWEEMPRYRRLAGFVSLPGVYHVACFVYDYALAPAIYRMYLRRIRRKPAKTA